MELLEEGRVGGHQSLANISRGSTLGGSLGLEASIPVSFQLQPREKHVKTPLCAIGQSCLVRDFFGF